MALHELATNAVKYGAVSVDDGGVQITWQRDDDSGTPRVRLQWSERDGPSAREPDRRGFGHTVLVGIVAHDLGAEVHLTHAVSGVIWEMTAPAQRVLDESARQS
jgi:two-component sensor histidine kinase